MSVALDRAERIAVIVGAAMGVVALGWQVFDGYEARRERIAIETGRLEMNGDSITLVAAITNLGQRPAYLRRLLLQSAGGGGVGVAIRFPIPDDSVIPIDPGRMLWVPSASMGVSALNQLVMTLGTGAEFEALTTRQVHQLAADRVFRQGLAAASAVRVDSAMAWLPGLGPEMAEHRGYDAIPADSVPH